MKILSLLLVIAGFCLGTLGAAGYNVPEDDVTAEVQEKKKLQETTWATPLFAGGLVLLVVGGVLQKQAKGAAASSEDGAHPTAFFRAQIDTIRRMVVDLDQRKDALDQGELRDLVGDLIGREFFELTSRHEEFAGIVGFTHYARVWEHVASAERLLNRYWSMATDGHHDEARQEIEYARKSIERAHEAVQQI
ncbi:MAG: hypothetical protein AAF581_04445 [Planctomycetota bacterium]